MANPTTRFGGGFLALAAIWIGVYWVWEPGQNAKVSFASDPMSGGYDSPSAATTHPTQIDPSRSSETLLGDAQPQIPNAEIPRSDATSRTEHKDVTKTGSTVIPPAYREYTVQKYDTFESISKKFYGTTRYANAVIGANPYVSPTSLQVGRTLRVPIDPENVQGRLIDSHAKATVDPEFIEYVVVRGDTLSEISQRFYGSMRYAKEIYNANISTMKSMDDLHVGQNLRIPSKSRVHDGSGNIHSNGDT